ncbi:uncharacterized protein LODBEIA_P42840 [Lodderomyces beijingensis]|uniref:Uncharacterized protein n=1 Tax=Lodderomyces beijingensis TaxID=1775926 RepID=A0ABP0ZPI2_9ASCO
MEHVLSQLKSNPAHKRAICDLYRVILRKAVRLRKCGDERGKTLYWELKIGAYEAFTKNYHTTFGIAQGVQRGIHLVEHLDAALDTGNWAPLTRWVQDYHDSLWQWQKRRVQFLHNKKEINDRSINLKRGKAYSLAHLKRQKIGQPLTESPKLSTLDLLKSKRHQASKNGQMLLLRYINRLIVDGKIPNPQLLPYTSDNLRASGDSYHSSHVVAASNQDSVNEAFDQDMVEALLVPDMEFEINDMYMNQLQRVVNEHGPYQAVAKVTQAGVRGVPYLMSPFKYAIGRKEVSQRIKEQVLCSRILNIWNSTEPVAEENMDKSGMYGVKGSKGFGDDELIRPRSFYQRYGEDEEMYEWFLERATKQREATTATAAEEEDMGSAIDWTSELAAVTQMIGDKLADACGRPLSFDLQLEQERLQKSCDEMYCARAERYHALISDLKKYKVLKHSEIVSPPNSAVPVEAKLKMPQRYYSAEDRAGRGMKLGDFMKSHKLRSFQFGNVIEKDGDKMLKELSRRW